MATEMKPQRTSVARESSIGLSNQGLAPRGEVHWNLIAPELFKAAARRDEGEFAEMGPFVAITTPHTGRSPEDKFVVKESSSDKDVDWGKVNQPMSTDKYELLLGDVRRYLNDSRELFVEDLYCGADQAYRLSVRYVSPNAWHMAFARNMFIRPEATDLPTFDPNFTVLHAPEFKADPARHGTRSRTFIVLDPATKKVKFADQSITENTRASYPLHYIRNHVEGGRGGHPHNVIFLTADAFGVLPPIAKLTPEQAMYYFLSGYTAKVAGTERGVKEPQPTFSACFGAAFLVWHATKYAAMLGELLSEHTSNVWLVNTGWSGGAYGTGKRMQLEHN